MSQIFVSYARPDRARVEALVAEFEREGWSVWWDPVIPPGKRWDDVVEEALQAAKCVVVVWTPNSVASEWVRTEAADAKVRGVLVPVILQSVTLPLEFRRIEACNLSEWHPGSVSSEFDLLVSAIRNLLDTEDAERSSGVASASSIVGKRKSHGAVVGIVVGFVFALALVAFGYRSIRDKTERSNLTPAMHETAVTPSLGVASTNDLAVNQQVDTTSQQSTTVIAPTVGSDRPASSAARTKGQRAPALTPAVWRKNWLTINDPIPWMGGSDGTRATNREQFTDLLTALDLREVPAVARKRDSLLQSLRNAPARPEDTTYNVAVPSDFDTEFRSLKRAIRDLAVDAGVVISD